MKKFCLFCAAVLLASFFLLQLALADGEGCAKYRPLNSDEKAWFGQFTILRSAVPTAPAGWELSDSSREYMAPGYGGIPEKVCSASPNYNLGINIYYQKKHNAADDATINRVAQMKPDPAKKAQIDRLIAQQTELAGRLGAAAVKQDLAEVDKLNAQLEPLNEQIKRSMDEMYAPQTQAIAVLEQDRNANVRITTNSTGSNCFGHPEVVDVPGAVAWRCAHENNYHVGSTDILDHARARMIVVFGQVDVRLDPWARRNREGQETADQSVTLNAMVDNKRPNKVQNLVVEIESDNPQRVATLYKGMKLDGLRTLLH